MDLENVLNYYQNYEEDNRLLRDNTHQVEFLTTIKYIDQILKQGDKILEIGAGTGAYSYYYANKGFDVTAVELVDKNIDILKDKLQHNNKINIIQGDARDLSMITQKFDVVLCLGPLYHLKEKEDKLKCIQESLRLVKPNGYIAFSYINSYMAYLTKVNRDTMYANMDTLIKNVDQGIDQQDIFCYMKPDEIENLLSDFPIKTLQHIGTDGISYLMAKQINQMTKKEFKVWLTYHFKTCYLPHFLGNTLHGLVICQLT